MSLSLWSLIAWTMRLYVKWNNVNGRWFNRSSIQPSILPQLCVFFVLWNPDLHFKCIWLSRQKRTENCNLRMVVPCSDGTHGSNQIQISTALVVVQVLHVRLVDEHRFLEVVGDSWGDVLLTDPHHLVVTWSLGVKLLHCTERNVLYQRLEHISTPTHYIVTMGNDKHETQVNGVWAIHYLFRRGMVINMALRNPELTCFWKKNNLGWKRKIVEIPFILSYVRLGP